MSRGFCPHCNGMTDRQVRQTNFVLEDEAVYRRNHCPRCGENFITAEKAADVEANKTSWTYHWTMGEE